MKRYIPLLGLLLALLVADTAQARWRLFGRRYRVRGYSSRIVVGGSEVWGNAATDQERCQAEAEYMARNQSTWHVGPTIGSFEGCGWYGSSHYGTPTCTPRAGMTLTGDGAAQDVHGRWYRVRSWR